MEQFLTLVNSHKEVNIFLGMMFAFGITFVVIPIIIKIAHLKNLMDVPGERASHSTSIPTLGGLGIFIGFILSVTFWTNFADYLTLQYIEFSLILIFFLGIKDDLVNLSAGKKAAGILLAAFVVVYYGEVRITYFYGLLGMYKMNESFSIVFSILTIFVIVNAFNLIDGINGLGSSMAIISAGCFGYWFFAEGTAPSYQLVIIIASLIGAVAAFMKYNVTPASIFMGDTGSLIIGLLISIFAIEFIETNLFLKAANPVKIKSAPVIALGAMAIPLCDMVKVFIVRIYRKRSPFSADRNHIHHVFLRLGFSHTQTTVILSVISVGIISVMVSLKTVSLVPLLLILVVICSLVCVVPMLILKRKDLAELGCDKQK